MISGIHAHICDKCVTQASQILVEEKKNKVEVGNLPNFKLIKPRENQEIPGRVMSSVRMKPKK